MVDSGNMVKQQLPDIDIQNKHGYFLPSGRCASEGTAS